MSALELDKQLAVEDVVFLQFAADNNMQARALSFRVPSLRLIVKFCLCVRLCVCVAQEVYRQVASRLQDILVFLVAAPTDTELYKRYGVSSDDDVTLVLKDGRATPFAGEYTLVRTECVRLVLGLSFWALLCARLCFLNYI